MLAHRPAPVTRTRCRGYGDDEGVTSTSSPRLRVLLARQGYRRLWAARTVSQVGDVAQFTTLALLLVHLTGSAVGVTGAVLAEIAAVLQQRAGTRLRTDDRRHHADDGVVPHHWRSRSIRACCGAPTVDVQIDGVAEARVVPRLASPQETHLPVMIIFC